MKERGPLFFPLVFVAIVVVALVALVGFGIAWLKNVSLENVVTSSFVTEQIVSVVGEDERPLVELLPTLLGVHEPQTYLLLFLNNTELRPGGGFLGSYAVVRIEKGEPHVVIMEGSEGLDRRAVKELLPAPPDILTRELGVDRWFFRDSNWSPDFLESTQKTLELYGIEGGVAAGEIDAVIGVTPTVLEELLALVGPVTVDGITFTKENVTETLEYEVEYGYQGKDIPFEERKGLIERFMFALIDKIGDDLLTRPGVYIADMEKLLAEKHILVAGLHPELQNIATERDWTGRVRREVAGDYLLWVDANLAALKTDHALVRELSYRVSQDGEQQVARATMQYTHTGGFDWRTTRYRTYARTYVPAGADLRRVAAVVGDSQREIPLDAVDTGTAYGKQWFGTFFVLEPGTVGSLTFEYVLPTSIAEQVTTGAYTLLVQKQLGTVDHALVLDLAFPRPVSSALPAEDKSKWGDARYELKTNLRVDRSILIKTQ